MKRRGRTFVETWEHHRYKEKADIYLVRETGEFVTDYAEEHICFKELEQVRAALSKTVEQAVNLDWIPVIMVEIRGEFRAPRDVPFGKGATTEEEVDYEDNRRENGEASLHLHFSRFWIAKRPDGLWISCRIWRSQDDDGKSDRYDSKRDNIHAPSPRRLNSETFYTAKKDFALPYRCIDSSWGEKRPTHYLRYTPKLWSGLNQIANKLEELNKRLQELVGSDEGIKLIENLVGKLLPAPKKGA
jgi:hypothetical protein